MAAPAAGCRLSIVLPAKEVNIQRMQNWAHPLRKPSAHPAPSLRWLAHPWLIAAHWERERTKTEPDCFLQSGCAPGCTE